MRKRLARHSLSPAKMSSEKTLELHISFAKVSVSSMQLVTLCGEDFAPMASFADTLRDARKRRNLSQKDLARQVGLTPNAICQLECGNNNPSYKTYQKLVALLALPVPGAAPGGGGERGHPPWVP